MKTQFTHTAQITLVGMNGSLGIASAEFEVAGTKKLDGSEYLDSVLKSAYEAVLAEQKVTVDNVAVNISGMYSANQFHRYVCNVLVKGTMESGEKGSFSDEVHVYVDRTTFKPIEKE